MSPEALRKTNEVAALDAAADHIRELMKKAAMNTVEIGTELKRVRDEHFPWVRVTGKKGRTRPGWLDWIKANLKISYGRASQLIRLSEAHAKRLGNAGAHTSLPAAVLEEIMRFSETEIEDEVIAANEESIRKRGKPISHRKARAIARKKKRELRGEKESKPHLPKPKEAKRIAAAARDRGDNILVLASDNNYYTGAKDEEVAAHQKILNLVFTLERAVEFIAGLELTPHKLVHEDIVPVWLRWWRTKDQPVSAKGEKIHEAAAWLQAMATAVGRLR